MKKHKKNKKIQKKTRRRLEQTKLTRILFAFFVSATDGQHKALLSTTTTSTTSDGADLDASALPTEMQLATVTAMGGQVSKAASQLQALELPFPDTGPLARLAELSPLMAVLADRQTAQALEISELRKRSMMAVSRYKKVHVEGQRDVWREWGATLGAWERTAAREEKRRAKEGE